MKSTDPSQPAARSRYLVARNTMVLMLGQFLGMPLSMLVNVLMGRILGPEQYGRFFVLGAFVTLGLLFAEFGMANALPTRIAAQRAAAGLYLGSAIAWEVLATLVISTIMLTGAWLHGSSPLVLVTLALLLLGQGLTLLVRLVGDATRGLERAELAALSQLAIQAVTALLVIPTLLMGGQLNACLIATAVAVLVVLIPTLFAARRGGLHGLRVDMGTARMLVQGGVSFLVLNLVLYLQPTIDAWFMTAYASEQAIGWNAAARKLINPMIYPSTALTAALFPTLSRLWHQDRGDFARTTREALHASVLITIPLAVGCAAFAELGILLYSKEAYGPAITNLRILAAYMFPLYMSMVLGTCLNAIGRQRTWTAVQCLCIVISLVADPLLVPWFQQHYGNGGLGVNLTTLGSELVMMSLGFWLLPSGIIDRGLLMQLLRASAAGAAMALCAWLLADVPLWVSIPATLATYAIALIAFGGLKLAEVSHFLNMMRRGRQPV